MLNIAAQPREGRKKDPMAHEIDTTTNANGAAIFALTPAWHGLGTVLDHAFTSAEALSQAGLDFTVSKMPLGFWSPIDQKWHEFPGRFATVREDTQRGLGVVQKKYEVLQTLTCFETMDQIFREQGCKYEAAGVLYSGEKIWLLARMPQDEQITDAPGDTIQTYALLTSGHDGLTATELLDTTTRVVCNNTLRAALGAKRGSKSAHRIVHSANQSDRLAEAAEAFADVFNRTRQVATLARRLADIPAKDEQVEEAVKFSLDWFIGTEDRILPDGTVEKIVRRENKRKTDGAILLDQILTETQLVGRNMWGVLNGATRYSDHCVEYRGANAAETRMTSILSGDVNDFKAAFVEQVCGKYLLSAMVA